MGIVPYEELLMSPNREPAERLGAIVGRRFVFSREQWPAWQRLVAKFTWPVVVKAADACDPTKRFPNQVEAMCLQLANVTDEPVAPPPPRPPPSPKAAKEAASLFSSIRTKYGV